MKKRDENIPISFEAVLERVTGATTYIHIVRFPHSVERLFGTRGQVRVKAWLNGLPMDRSLLPAGDGTHYLIINLEQRRMARVRMGDMVTIELERDESNDEPELPEELEVALDMDAKALDAFGRLTLAKRREIVAYIASARRPETRERRAIEVTDRLARGLYMFGGPKE